MRKILLLLLIVLFSQYSYAQKELQPDFDKAVKLLKEENFQKAVEGFSAILNKATADQLKKFCYIYRAFSYNGLEEFSKAVADLDKAIELDPDDIASYTDRGKTKAYMADLKGARKDFLYILSKDSIAEQGQAAYYYLAKIEYSDKKFKESIQYYDKLIKLTPNDAELYFNKGVANGMLMNTEASIKDYNKAIELHPDYMEAYANRGVAKINLLTTKGTILPTKEQTADACTDLKKARSMGDKTVDDMIFAYCDKK